MVLGFGKWVLRGGKTGGKKVLEKLVPKPQVEKTGTKEVIEHFKKAVSKMKPEDKASIYKTHVAPYVRKWSGKKSDKPSKKKD